MTDQEFQPLTEAEGRQVGLLITALAQAAQAEMPNADWEDVDRLVAHTLCLSIQRAEALQASAGDDDRLAGSLAAIKMLTSREAWSTSSLADKARALAAGRLADAGLNWPVPDHPASDRPVSDFQRKPEVH